MGSLEVLRGQADRGRFLERNVAAGGVQADPGSLLLIVEGVVELSD